MSKKTCLITSFIVGGSFLIIDQTLKYLAFNNPDLKYYIINPWLGWQYTPNTGIAFGLPVPIPITILLTPIIFLLLFYYWKKIKNKSNLFYFGISLIVFGAISNFIDRFFVSITIDYFRVLTSIMNLADIMIVSGAVLLIINEQRKKHFI